MDTLTVRHVSPRIREALKAKARLSGRSLQEVALEALEEKALRKSPEEWLAEVRERVERSGTGLGSDEVVRMLREERGDLNA